MPKLWFRPEDEAEMQKVQERFAVQVPELPDQIDMSTYSKQNFCFLNTFSLTNYFIQWAKCQGRNFQIRSEVDLF